MCHHAKAMLQGQHSDGLTIAAKQLVVLLQDLHQCLALQSCELMPPACDIHHSDLHPAAELHRQSTLQL